MKKFLVLAMAATLLMAGSAFAVQRNLNGGAGLLLPRPELTFATGQPATTNNADSCDIGVTPAATLLLPYFEVDTAASAGAGATTLWTITNTSRFPQIAHVTVWTDWSFPVLDFNIFLTGYDVQGINMFDLIVRGIIVPGTPSGTSITTVPGTGVSPPANNTSNPNFILSGGFDVRTTCAGLPGTLPADLVTAVRNALTIGTGYNTGGVSCSGPVGGNHGTSARGYVTVDVASYCSTQLPTDPGGAYFTGATASILFDNTLIGDYQQIAPTPAGAGTAGTFDAQGNPMVHIRAIPEGGLSGAAGGIQVATNLPFTFYDRYTPAGAGRVADRRVPLPSTWAARFIQGGGGGFATDYKIWREGVTAGLPTCTSSGTVQLNSVIAITNLVRFDEHENSTGLGGNLICSPCAPSNVSLPEASRTSTTSSLFPPFTSTDLGGWMYLNLSSGSQHVTASGLVFDANLTAQRAGFGPNAPGTGGSRTTTQNWVVVSMFGVIGSNRLSVDFDAAWLGNGCTPAPSAGAVIAPATQSGGPLVCPTNTPSTNCGVGTLPPAVNP
jgi:hypothetical protein